MDTYMITKLKAWFHRQLRAVVNMPAHLTKVNNSTLREQFGLKAAAEMLLARIERKLKSIERAKWPCH